jgi:DNA repair exonuclease SbcCD ATPase subunit
LRNALKILILRGGNAMASNFLGSLGNLEGLVKGFTGLMPQDKPETKMLKAHTEISDLRKQELEIYAEIGKEAFERNSSEWPQAEKLKLVQANVADIEEKLKTLEEEREAAEQAKKEADAFGRCPSCGHSNPEGVKFCQECGAKLAKSLCVSCGAELAPGVRFCGTCGAKQGE